MVSFLDVGYRPNMQNVRTMASVQCLICGINVQNGFINNLTLVSSAIC